jgi:hypothetical protein
MNVMNALGWFLIALLSLGSLATVFMVGKPRQPTTAGVAALSVLFNALLITAILLWYPRS